MFSSYKKIYQIHNLFKQAKYSIPLHKILEELQCNRSTFHRIKSFLKDTLRAPIEYDRRYKGYKYDSTEGKTFELPGLWFSAEELEAFACFEHLLETVNSNIFSTITHPFHQRLHMLLKAQNIKKKNWYRRIKIIPIGTRITNDKILHAIAEAVLKSKKMSIIYKALYSGVENERIISPQTLLRYKDNWYLDALCHKRQDLRTFSVNRIQIVKILKKDAEIVPDTQLKDHFAGAYGIFSGKPEQIAEIKFFGKAAQAVSQEIWHPEQQGVMNKDNTFTLKIPFNDSTELIMDILRWGDKAKVINPPALREEIIAIIEKMRKNYKKL